MKITDFSVKNYRGIHSATITNAGSAVVIAGPNGSGKSCFLDAIRLFKSAYGSYQQSELDLLSNEFQLNWRGGPRDFRGLLRNKNEPLRVVGAVEVSTREKKFLLNEGAWMLADLLWKDLYPQVPIHNGQIRTFATRETQKMIKDVHQRTTEAMTALNNELELNRLQGSITIAPDGTAVRADGLALRLLFGYFVPAHMGIIDYHGSHRKYDREQLRTITLTEADEEEKIKSGALYNYETKYANLKSAMAAELVRELLERAASGRRTGRTKPLADTMKELFQRFLPGKTFSGPVPTTDGDLTFPVQISDGAQHDINELSSGEKEILFAYLRARALSPRQSVLLIDEPELHLNPGLVQGLPAFYEQHIGRELENQIWLVTHSDRFLREAVDTVGMSVYHMQHAQSSRHSDQLRKIDSQDPNQAPLIDLVGELASYRPQGRVVLLEGANSRFDERVVTRLFPDAASSINFLSAGSKASVQNLRKTLAQLAKHGQATKEVYYIADPDDDIWSRTPEAAGFRREWTVYHIENYLIDTEHIRLALEDVHLAGASGISDQRVNHLLEEAAEQLIPELAIQTVRDQISRHLRKSVEVQLDHKGDASDSIVNCMKSAAADVEEIRNRFGNKESASRLFNQEVERFRGMWDDGRWQTHFPGRKILRRFCGLLGVGVSYESLRNAILGEMVKHRFQPSGMRTVIQSIVDA